MDPEPGDDAAQRVGDDDRLEHQRDRRGDVKMRRVLDIGLPCGGAGDQGGLQAEGVEDGKEAPLIEQREADEEGRCHR